MSKSEAIKSATRQINATPERPLIADRPSSIEPVKRTRKPRDPNAPPRVKRVKPTVESELSGLLAKYTKEVQPLREQLHALDVKRRELAETLASTEAKLSRIKAVVGGDADEPGPDSPVPGEAPAAPPESGGFIPPDAAPIDPNNQ